ncbi:zinc finger CCCH domain-containing protein 2-like [Zingiber officinale]|nr:zinc finger CCCH domain-containing protein 2-like [Zingiber officinale]
MKTAIDGQTAFMMIGRGISHLNPIASVPPRTPFDDLTVGNFASSPFHVSSVITTGDCLPFDEAMLASLQFYPTHEEEVDSGSDAPPMVDAYASDEFRIYDFKVKICGRGRSHDWADCPFAHPGEKARRRDLRKHSYSGTACPDFRKPVGCKRGDACELAHGVFECWLHPDRYRTQPCKDGTDCRRRVCFFAHTPDQLRGLQTSFLRQSAAVRESYDGSPLRHQSSLHYSFSKGLASSPTSTLISPPKSPPAESPPISPSGGKLLRASWPASSSMNEIVASLRQLQLNRAESMPSTRGLQMGNTGFVSPRGAAVGFDTAFRSLPATPVGVTAGWPEEHLPMGRVESGRELRAKMFERLSKNGIFDEAEAAPDVEWVSDLLK